MGSSSSALDDPSVSSSGFGQPIELGDEPESVPMFLAPTACAAIGRPWVSVLTVQVILVK